MGQTHARVESQGLSCFVGTRQTFIAWRHRIQKHTQRHHGHRGSVLKEGMTIKGRDFTLSVPEAENPVREFPCYFTSRKIHIGAILDQFWSLGALPGLARVGLPRFFGFHSVFGVHFGSVPAWWLCGYRGLEGRFRDFSRFTQTIFVRFRDFL